MISILVVEDHPILLRVVKAVLAQQPDFAVVGEAASGEQALVLIRDLQPDVVILDMQLADGSCLDRIKHMHEACLQACIIVYSIQDYAPYSDVLATLGVSKFISKLAPMQELLQAIRVSQTLSRRL